MGTQEEERDWVDVANDGGARRVLFRTQPDVLFLTLQDEIALATEEDEEEEQDEEWMSFRQRQPHSGVSHRDRNGLRRGLDDESFEESLSYRRQRNKQAEEELHHISEKLSHRLEELNQMLKRVLDESGEAREEDKQSHHSDSVMECQRTPRPHTVSEMPDADSPHRTRSVSPSPPRVHRSLQLGEESAEALIPADRQQANISASDRSRREELLKRSSRRKHSKERQYRDDVSQTTRPSAARAKVRHRSQPRQCEASRRAASKLFCISTFARFPRPGVTEQSLARADWFYTGAGDRVQCFKCNPNMCREQDRLDSFHSWTVPVISPAELAKAGFYYLGQGDKVACFSCGRQLSSWATGVQDASEHQRHYANCSFVRRDRADNIPLAKAASGGVTSQLSTGAPALTNVSNPAMRQSDVRLLTFINWPSRIPVRPGQLAKAGFYYVGRNDDVRCFCCDGGLRCWVSEDDPWVGHAKWFPRCEYLLQEKGQEFVHQIQVQFPRLFKWLLTTGDNSSRRSANPPVAHLSRGEEMMNTPVIKSALEMGFECSLVKQTVRSKILTSGENYRTVQELVSDLLSAEDQKREEERKMTAEDGFTFVKRHQAALIQRLKSAVSVLQHLREQNVLSHKEYSDLKVRTSTQQQTAQLIELVLTKGNVAAEIFRNWIQKNDVHLLRDLMAQSNEAASPSPDLSDLPMKEQLRRLQEMHTCKVCLDKEVSVVFIPCGHLVACKECAPSLRKCPICRGRVKGTVRTYLS